MFVVGAVAVLAAMAGFWAGRSIRWQLAEAAEIAAEENGAAAAESRGQTRGGAREREQRDEYGNERGNGEVWENGIMSGIVSGGMQGRAQGGMPGVVSDGVHGGMPVRMPGRTRGGWRGRFDKRRQTKTVSLGREIGSPVTGQVSVFEEEGRRKLRILPDRGMVYAPAAGRIRRLYPMGSAILLQTEFGAEILLKIGSHVDEMCSGYYDCRVMEHEYIRKGTLLLEYDPAGLCGEGAEPEIILSVENEEELGAVTLTGSARMKAGEPILYVVCGKHSESYEKLV